MPQTPDVPKTILHSKKPEKRPASLAHQLSNSLLGVKVLLEDFYERAVLSSEDTELLNIAIEECRRMQSMIDDLQTFSAREDADIQQAFELK